MPAPRSTDGADPADHDVLRARALRRSGRAARRRVVGERRTDAQARIVGHLLGLSEFSGAARMGLYLPTDGEVDPTGAVGELRSRGWMLHVPVVGPGTAMLFRPWHHGDELTANRFGIPEPVADGRNDVPATDLDVVLVPCVAVDPAGHRLGFGAGFYDRALAGRDERPVTVGVAFDVQVNIAVPNDRWDIPLQVVVTESRVMRTAG